MRFMDAYKYLEQLCSDMLGDYHGVSAYIDAMRQIPYGRSYVAGWDSDLQLLSHYRRTRNRIVHEVGYTEEDLCTPEDIEWLNNFYDRIMNQTDPLALYRQAMQQRAAASTKKLPQATQQQVSAPRKEPHQAAQHPAGTTKGDSRNKVLFVAILCCGIVLAALLILAGQL